VAGEVVRRAHDGDVVVTMGAPPISLMGDELLAALAARSTSAKYVARHARGEDAP
jgi:UDP-N-acetylmuramate--alanine ligase